MASLEAQRLLALAALLLLVIIPTETEVVKLMTDCADFFLGQTPPRVPGILEGGNILNQSRYRPICQTFKNTRTFVTLYDTHNKIPVFSASKYRGHSSGRPRSIWNIEPQLEDIRSNDNMETANDHVTYNYQAGNSDYKNQRVTTSGPFTTTSVPPSTTSIRQSSTSVTFTSGSPTITSVPH
nr:PREDICTED: endonuclease domain-containing 1 protein-like [Stegastes partitus]